MSENVSTIARLVQFPAFPFPRDLAIAWLR
jgi:hypothetical protein